MAALTQSNITSGPGSVAVTVATLSASDTLTYSSGTNQVLTITNGTAGPLTATLTGSTATTIAPAGYGSTVSVAGGYAVVVAAGATKAVKLDNISAYLSGTITITGAATCTAMLTV